MAVSLPDGTGKVSKTIARPTDGSTTATATLTGLPHVAALPVAVKAFPNSDGTCVAQAMGVGTVSIGENAPGTVAGKTTVLTVSKDAQGAIFLPSANGRSERIVWTCDDPVAGRTDGSGPTHAFRSGDAF